MGDAGADLVNEKSFPGFVVEKTYLGVSLGIQRRNVVCASLGNAVVRFVEHRRCDFLGGTSLNGRPHQPGGFDTGFAEVEIAAVRGNRRTDSASPHELESRPVPLPTPDLPLSVHAPVKVEPMPVGGPRAASVLGFQRKHTLGRSFLERRRCPDRPNAFDPSRKEDRLAVRRPTRHHRAGGACCERRGIPAVVSGQPDAGLVRSAGRKSDSPLVRGVASAKVGSR